MATAVQNIVAKVQDTATARKSDRSRSPQMDVGDHVRQGDLYVYRILRVPGGAKETAAIAQLAEGDTQGSRHVLDGLDGVTMFRLPDPNALQGPILSLTECRTLTHPEHGHIVLEPGIYAVTYQRAHADEVRRVAD